MPGKKRKRRVQFKNTINQVDQLKSGDVGTTTTVSRTFNYDEQGRISSEVHTTTVDFTSTLALTEEGQD